MIQDMYRAEQLWSNYDFTKAQKVSDEVKGKSNANMRKTQNAGIDPETLEEIDQESMDREKYLKDKLARLLANSRSSKKICQIKTRRLCKRKL